MKYQLIYGLFICCALFACADDDAPSPSYGDKDWYEIKNDPNADKLDQLRYTIYKNTNIPIFYNDTLGSEIRYDGGGNPYTYYSVFKIGYIFTSSGSNTKYQLSKDRDAILCMTELLRDYTIPLLAERFRPRGFLIVDTLSSAVNAETGIRPRLSGYKDLEMTIAGLKPAEDMGLPFVTEMTADEKEMYGYTIAFLELYAYLSREFASRIEYFAELSRNTGINYNVSIGKNQALDPEDYGFFRFAEITTTRVKMPTIVGDMNEYISRIHFRTAEEIQEEIKGHPVMIEKYGVILEILKDCGFEYWIHE